MSEQPQVLIGSGEITAAIPRPAPPPGVYERGPVRHTEAIGQLAAAMAKAHAQIKIAGKSADNPFFKSKYADLASIHEACMQALAANGVWPSQPVTTKGTEVTVLTKLIHSSGEWIECPLTMTAEKSGPQSIGSAITYARRYGLAALVGVAAGDEDDDGEAAEGRPQPRGKQMNPKDYKRPSEIDKAAGPMPDWGK